MFQNVSQVGNLLQNRESLLSLKPGQLFSGKILKHYPDQLAALSIRGTTVVAKLETMVNAGSSYWFLVKEGQGVPKLQVVQPDIAAAKTETLAMNSTQLTTSKEGQMLLQDLKLTGTPFTRDQLKEGAQLLKDPSISRQLGLDTIRTMIQQQLPLTKGVFQSLVALAQSPHLSEGLTNLETKLASSAMNQSSQMMQAFLSRTDGPSTQSPVDQILKTLLDRNASPTEKQAAMAILSKLQWPGVASNSSVDSFLTKWMPTDVSTEISLIKQSLLSENDLSKIHRNWASMIQQPTTTIEQQLIQKAVKETVMPHVFVNGKQMTFANQLLNLVQLVGYQDEANVANQPLAPSIKSLLVQLMGESQSSEIRTQAERVLHTITGHQIQSLSSDPAFVQTMLSLPITLGEWKTDLMIQWQGKKQDDTTIDPENCRLLFFLELERLKETMVQVTIQKKIVHVTVTNHQDRPDALIKMLEPIIKQSLEKMDYQFTAVSWKTWPTESPVSNNRTFTPPQVPTSYQGMDIRI
ncbi:hypothetical protein MKY91_11895 [Alkalicoccobacillus gibsonii]|uniref:Flagellar hook-length control protein-like C-terminal domain-containing protein n=1 Tax=Alkalicoccobacillus gibsonii TaxID=79881 RepID=A0ABU9VIY1_9BACI